MKGELSMMNPRSEQYAALRRRMAQMGIGTTQSDIHCCERRNDADEANDRSLRRNGGCAGEKDQNNVGWGLYDYPLAMVYSPYQLWRNTYNEDDAFERGTLFGELDLPFEGCNNR